MGQGTVAKRLALPLFTRAELETLAGLELPALALALASSRKLGVAVPECPSVAELHRAVRLSARHHALTVGRWEGAGPALAVFYAEQDRRSLAALLEGAREGTPREARLEGLIPTPTLTECVLQELSRQVSVADVVSVLTAVGHPFAARLGEGDGAALHRAWVERARHLARRDSALTAFVEARAAGHASGMFSGVMSVLSRLESQTRDLRRVLWGATVCAPRELVVGELLTA